MDQFWEVVRQQLTELRTATSADDVVRILSNERNPYRLMDGREVLDGDRDGFFAGSGGDDTVWEALVEAGWKWVWSEANYYWAMRAPDGSVITYVEGDIYRGDRKAPAEPTPPVRLPDGRNRHGEPFERVSHDPDGLDCYSDHEHDIRYAGVCEMCGSTEVEVVGHVLPDHVRLKGIDPVKASAFVVKTGTATMVDGVLLDLFSASAVQAVYAALSKESARAKLRGMTLTQAVTVCFKVINKANG